MTIQSVFPIALSDVASELRTSLPINMIDARTLWLAGLAVQPIAMNQFAGQQAMKQVAITGLDAGGTSHTFPGVNFGSVYFGRIIQVNFFAVTKDTAETVPAGHELITGLTVGGVGPVVGGAFGWWYWQGGSGSTVFVGQNSNSFAPGGTSGTIQFTTAMNTRCFCVVISKAGVTGVHNGGGTSTGGSNINYNFTPSNNGILEVSAISHGNPISMSGVTTRGTSGPLAGYNAAWGWDNRQSNSAHVGTISSASSDAMAASGSGQGDY